METLNDHLPSDASDSKICISCKTPLRAIIGKSSICEDCREKFIKYPIPLWIKAFGIGLLLILIFSLFSFSSNIETGIHLKRGKIAFTNLNYLSAEKEFQIVVKREPGYIEGQCYLLLSAYRNHDYYSVMSAFSNIQNQKLDNIELVNKVNEAISGTSAYLPSDSALSILQQYKMNIDSIPALVLYNYVIKNDSDSYFLSAYAGYLIDNKKYGTADSILNKLLVADPDQYNALALKVSLKRDLNQLDSSFFYSDKMISMNHEDIYAISSKARTLLKQKKDDEALKLAKQSYDINNKDGYTLATLALIYHFENKNIERDELLVRAAQDSTAISAISYVKDIISGKEIFRN